MFQMCRQCGQLTAGNCGEIESIAGTNICSEDDPKAFLLLFLQLYLLLFCSEADKVPGEGLTVKDKGKGHEKESEKGKKHAEGPSPTTQSASVSQ